MSLFTCPHFYYYLFHTLHFCLLSSARPTPLFCSPLFSLSLLSEAVPRPCGPRAGYISQPQVLKKNKRLGFTWTASLRGHSASNNPTKLPSLFASCVIKKDKAQRPLLSRPKKKGEVLIGRGRESVGAGKTEKVQRRGVREVNLI